MLARFNALVLSFIIVLLLLTVPSSAFADGMWGVEGSQDQGSISVTGPEGPHTPPKSLFPLYAGDTLTETIYADPTGGGTNSSGQECTLDSVTYSHKNVIMTYYTGDGAQTSSTNIGSASISAGNPATLTASFPVPGYYTISYTIHMDYTSKTCGDGSAETTGNLSFAVQAGDFDFTLNPSYLVVPSGGNATTVATITSYNGFHNAVSFSRGGETLPPGFTVSGSGTPPPSGNVDTPVAVSVDKSFPFSMDATPSIITVRGQSQVGSVLLAHDHPLSVLVNFVWITGPYDKSNHKGATGPEPNKRNADGSITTDSVLSYTTDGYGVPLSDPWRGSAALTGNNTAGLDLVYKWTTGHGDFSTNYSKSSVYSVNQSEVSNPNGPFEATTTTATDAGSGAKPTYGSNSYTIRWHHQYEGWGKDNSKKVIPTVVSTKADDSSGFPSVMSFEPTATWNRFAFDYDALNNADLIVKSVGGAFVENKAFKALLNIVAVKVDDLGKVITDIQHFGGQTPLRPAFVGGIGRPEYINFYNPDPVTAYGWKDSLTDQQKLDIEDHYQAVNPRYTITYDDTWYLGDVYDAGSGYVGAISRDILIFNPNNANHVSFTFELAKQQLPPPTQ